MITTAELERLHWYHSIDLGSGIVTPGDFDLRDQVEQYGLPARLDGLRVLDVGCSSGFWSFELEKRGGAVMAIDVAAASQDIWSVVRGERAEAKTSSALGPREGEASSPFQLARRTLGSRVEFRQLSVYDLEPSEMGLFDLVFCGSMLMHLSDPFRALQKIAGVSRGLLVVSSTYFENGSALPSAVFKLNPRSIWTPNVACLAAMLNEAGFGEVREKARISLRHQRDNADVPHVIFHAKGRKT